MNRENNKSCEREYDFSLILGGVEGLSRDIEDALYEAGCGDATFTIQHGRLYAEFSRTAKSLKDAILSAVRDIQKANIGAKVLRVDECDLVTAADIARRTKRTRQSIHQMIKGSRGPGGFPPPECSLTDNSPLWGWCAVSYWLAENNIIRPEELEEAEVIAVINNRLDRERYRERNRALTAEIDQDLMLN